MELEQDFKNALIELRKTEQRKFDQTVDLVLNLQKIDIRKSTINTFVQIPHKSKEKKIAAFLEVKNKNFDTITPEEFLKYQDKKIVKKMIAKYDFFIAQSSIMPKVATVFGRYLGPTGKMPSPQLGILMNPDEKELLKLKDKINSSVRIKLKEPSIKVAIGKQSMKDEELIENAMSIYNSSVKLLPRDKENIKNIELKFTMTKPVRIKIR
jgi:large subunit ribosomal protein L1